MKIEIISGGSKAGGIFELVENITICYIVVKILRYFGVLLYHHKQEG